MDIKNITLIIFKFTIIALNLCRKGDFYNSKNFIKFFTITILTYIGTPITLTISLVMTIFNLKNNRKRKSILNEIKNDFGSDKYKELYLFIEKYSLNKDNLVDVIKADILRKVEIQLSILILSMCFLGLCISPLVGAILTLCTYLIAVLLKATLKLVLNKPYTNISLLNNIELELRTGNISSIRRTFKISNTTKL